MSKKQKWKPTGEKLNIGIVEINIDSEDGEEPFSWQIYCCIEGDGMREVSCARGCENTIAEARRAALAVYKEIFPRAE